MYSKSIVVVKRNDCTFICKIPAFTHFHDGDKIIAVGMDGKERIFDVASEPIVTLDEIDDFLNALNGENGWLKGIAVLKRYPLNYEEEEGGAKDDATGRDD